ncbi:MarR family protein [anaerobic digester metagenome]
MDGFKFSLRDMPRQELLNEYAERIPSLKIKAVESCIALLRTVADVSKVLEDHFQEYEISEGKFTILMLLYRQSDYQLSPIELSKKAEVTKGTMTGLIAGLENQGLVEKQTNESDKRSYLVKLSSKGLKLLNDILPEHYKLIGEIMSVLDDNQLKEMSSSLNLISKKLVKMEGEK